MPYKKSSEDPEKLLERCWLVEQRHLNLGYLWLLQCFPSVKRQDYLLLILFAFLEIPLFPLNFPHRSKQSQSLYWLSIIFCAFNFEYNQEQPLAVKTSLAKKTSDSHSTFCSDSILNSPYKQVYLDTFYKSKRFKTYKFSSRTERNTNAI